jgi:hypothetical protein
MKLVDIAKIQSGYISRGRIKAQAGGAYRLLQARDVDGQNLSCTTDSLISFNPVLSAKDWVLRPGDILFMARGACNFAVLLGPLPGNVLAAACFFIVRARAEGVEPAYLCWYLNQDSAQRYFNTLSGQGVHMPVVRRAVLEQIDVPVPDTGTQKRIIALEVLRAKERQLSDRLYQMRVTLISAACLQAARRQR